MKILCILPFIFISLFVAAQKNPYHKYQQKEVLKEPDSAYMAHYFDSLQMIWKSIPSKSFPAFKAYSDSGKFYSNENFKNKITFINIWMEDCMPCVAEAEPLNDLFAKFKDNESFQFLSFTYENANTVSKYRKTFKAQYPIIHVSFDSCNKLNYRAGFPTTMIVDRNGKINFFTCGGPVNDAARDSVVRFYPMLEKLLSKKD